MVITTMNPFYIIHYTDERDSLFQSVRIGI
nr:MAG TPA: hypothetical protein [Caudoviricetes sp.]